jgi:chitinase
LTNFIENKAKTLLIIILLFIQAGANAQKKEIVAYYPEWRAKFPNPYLVKDIEKSGSADKITVLNYAFIIPEPDSSGNIIPSFLDSYLAYQQIYSSGMSVDGIADDSSQSLRGQFNQLKKLKQRHPNLKIILSIGGWTGSKYFSDAALTQKSREIFVNSCIERFILGDLPKLNNAGGKGSAANIFDGFDIDWEYPVKGGDNNVKHDGNDNNNLSNLYALFRAKLDSLNPNYLLTAAVPATEKYARFYNIYEDQQYLDWYNLMTYDYRGGWDTITGHNTNLLSSFADTTFNRERDSFDKTVHLYHCIYGVSRSKLIPGATFYGRGWKGVDSLNNGLGSNGSVAEGIIERGFNYYSDLMHLVDNNYKIYWDNYAMAPYLYTSKEKIFWTFDNVESISLKRHYVNAYDLKGLMFWEISGDDSIGTLVNTIYTGNMPDVNITSVENENRDNFETAKIEITKPKSSDWINEGSNVIIYTSFAESEVHIVKVEFFGDGKSLGYNTNNPFSWVWFNIPIGKHTIKVVGYYDNGSKKESQPVKIISRKK